MTKHWVYYATHPTVVWQNRHKIRLWRRFTYWSIQKLGLQKQFVTTYYGARFHPFPSSISKAIWLFGESFRRHDMLFLSSLLRPEDTFIDVGANVGTHSLCMARMVGGLSHIYSFEPHPRIYDYLHQNISLNQIKFIRTFNVGLAETEGTAYLSDEVLDDRNWLIKHPEPAGKVVVRLSTLDSFHIEGETIVVKMDIEGYELFALRGAEETLSRSCALYIEIGDRHTLRFGYSTRVLLEFLSCRGWRLFRFEDGHALNEICVEYVPSDVENIVGVRSVEFLSSRLPSYKINCLV